MRYLKSELRDCAKRELGYRKHVYPRLVESGKYTADKAIYEIGMMEAIMLHFSDLSEREEPSLFPMEKTDHE